MFRSKSAGVPEQTGHHSGRNRPPCRSKSATPAGHAGGLDPEDKEATLTGQTSQGQIIEGTDSVRGVPKGKK